jgi:hypothetical protein
MCKKPVFKVKVRGLCVGGGCVRGECVRRFCMTSKYLREECVRLCERILYEK